MTKLFFLSQKTKFIH